MYVSWCIYPSRTYICSTYLDVYADINKIKRKSQGEESAGLVADGVCTPAWSRASVAIKRNRTSRLAVILYVYNISQRARVCTRVSELQFAGRKFGFAPRLISGDGSGVCDGRRPCKEIEQ